MGGATRPLIQLLKMFNTPILGEEEVPQVISKLTPLQSPKRHPNMDGSDAQEIDKIECDMSSTRKFFIQIEKKYMSPFFRKKDWALTENNISKIKLLSEEIKVDFESGVYTEVNLIVDDTKNVNVEMVDQQRPSETQGQMSLNKV